MIIDSDNDDGSIYGEHPSDKPDIIDEIQGSIISIEKFLCAIASLWCFDMDLRNEVIIGKKPQRRNFCFCLFGNVMKPSYSRLGDQTSMNFLTKHKCCARNKSGSFTGTKSFLQHLDKESADCYHKMVCIFLEKLYNIDPGKKEKVYNNQRNRRR